MKTILLCLCLVIFVNAKPKHDKDMEIGDCIRKHDAKTDYGTKEGLKSSCAIYCVMSATGLMNKDGTFNQNEVKKHLPQGLFPLAKKCMAIKEKNGCATANNFYACYILSATRARQNGLF